MQIITLTLSPAFDVHCLCDHFTPFGESLASVTSREAGGKGVNISRALAQNHVSNLAIVALGEDNATDFTNLLSKSNVDFTPIYRSGRIRENITIHTAGKAETRISFSGFSADESLLSEAETIICTKLDASDSTILTLTGRVPDGVSMDEVKAFLKRLKGMGIRLVIDSKSFSTEDILEIKPFLIKPNEEELALYASCEICDESDIWESAKALFGQGIENVMISLGAKGAILACQDGYFRAFPPKIDAISTIGAGDSSIAGFLAAYSSSQPLCDCLCNAVAFGCAACLTPGTHPPLPHDVERIRKQVRVDILTR